MSTSTTPRFFSFQLQYDGTDRSVDPIHFYFNLANYKPLPGSITGSCIESPIALYNLERSAKALTDGLVMQYRASSSVIACSEESLFQEVER